MTTATLEASETTTEILTETHIIPEFNYATFADGIERMNRRAARLGVQPVQITRTLHSIRERWTRRTETVWHIVGQKSDGLALQGYTTTGEQIPFWSVTIDGEYPKLPGWTFLAVLSPVTDDEGRTTNILKTVPGKHCPAHLVHRCGECDHCRTRRQRNETFVIQHDDTAEVKVIGRNCIVDYLGGKTPEQLANVAALLVCLADLCTAAEDCDDWYEGAGMRVAYGSEITRLLEWTAAAIEVCGWIPRSQQDYGRTPTANVVQYCLFPPRGESAKDAELRDTIDAHRERFRDEALEALNWAQNLPDTETDRSNYLQNIRTLAACGWIPSKHFGLACSIVEAYRRAQGTARAERMKAERKASQHVGEIGKRYTLTLTCEKVISSEGYYGTTGIHKLIDETTGNRFTWFASGSADWLTEGDTVTVKATVTKHEEYKGEQITTVNRVKVQE